jgi:hypothetical protein
MTIIVSCHFIHYTPFPSLLTSPNLQESTPRSLGWLLQQEPSKRRPNACICVTQSIVVVVVVVVVV